MIRPRINHNIAPAILALAGGLFFTPSAKAQTVTTSEGDLILAFQATNSTLPGYTADLTIDLGPASTFYNAAGSGESFSLPGLALADLVATYGEDWDSRTDLQWGILGGYPSGSSGGNANSPTWTVWASSPQNANGTSTAWNSAVTISIGSFSTNTQNVPAQAIASVAGYAGNQSLLGSLNGSTHTANSTSAAVISTALSYSWAAVSTSQGGAAGTFGYFPSSIENNTDIQASASGYVASDLYELLPVAAGGTRTAGKLLGTFELSDSGLTFQAVPEPSAVCSLIAGGAALLMFARRRRK
jgi:hypothetical protein